MWQGQGEAQPGCSTGWENGRSGWGEEGFGEKCGQVSAELQRGSCSRYQIDPRRKPQGAEGREETNTMGWTRAARQGTDRKHGK